MAKFRFMAVSVTSSKLFYSDINTFSFVGQQKFLSFEPVADESQLCIDGIEMEEDVIVLY